MNHQNKHLFAYLKANLSPNQFRLVRIAPYILALFVLVNFTFTNLQYEANKPILEKYDDRQGIIYYYDKETNELFTGKASWILKFNDQKFEGSYQDGKLHGISRIWYENGNLAHRHGIKGGYFPVPPVDSAQDMRSEYLKAM